jgi:cytochrome c-type biogenesis protein CcmH/NrfG
MPPHNTNEKHLFRFRRSIQSFIKKIMATIEKMVKKETLLIAVAISLLLGFLGGTVFTTYKLHPTKTAASHPDNSHEPQGITLDNEQSKAITAFETEVKKNNSNGEAWHQLANLYYDTNQFKKAITAYTRAIDLVPANADILTDLGVMYRLDKQPDKAVESFDKAIAINPQHEPARLNKGVVLLYDFGRVPEALQTWQELLDVNPKAMTANGQSVRDLIADVKKEIEKSGKQEPKK